MTSVCSSTDGQLKRFKVALSFPGELRPFVEQVASHLAGKLGRERVLYDKYYESEFARPNLDLYLQHLYMVESELIAIFLNSDYERKAWPGLEWRVVRNLIMDKQGDTIMPFRSDHAEISGFFPTDGYISIENRSPVNVAQLILDRLDINQQAGPQVLPSSTTPTSWLAVLREILIANFVLTEGHPFQGYFSNVLVRPEAKRWQSLGGESVDHPTVPKRPYYQTYWGYRAALKIAPEFVPKWRPITIEAIQRHFGAERWLSVIRDYSFAKGPTSKPRFAETVRHTARAAALLYMLEPANRRVSETAWNLLSESSDLQYPEGGWKEFRGTTESPSLWSTVYVFQFLSMLVNSSQEDVPDERESFVARANLLRETSEQFLIKGWRRDRWSNDPDLPWQEVASVVLTEVTPFLTDRAFVGEAYETLRELVNPAGHLKRNALSRVADARSEAIQALGIAAAMKSAGEEFFSNDGRYHRLSRWVSEHLDLSEIRSRDVGLVGEVVDLTAPAPVK